MTSLLVTSLLVLVLVFAEAKAKAKLEEIEMNLQEIRSNHH